MLASISAGTLKQYNTTYKNWWQFCHARGLNVYKASISDIIQFLTEKFEANAGYSSLNTARSALSLLMAEEIGNDNRMKRFFRGLYRLKPALRRYTESWNPGVVLKLLTSWGNNKELNLERLSKKLVTLLALATAQRVQTLSLIKLEDISILESKISIRITELIKTSVSTKTQTTIQLPYFNQNPVICPARALQTYIENTAELRDNEKYLLLTFKKPFKRASTQTFSRWIKWVLKESGIDTNKFKAHSTRHSATSTAKQAGVSIDVIRKTAGWSENSLTFAKFYDVPINNDVSPATFVEAVLNCDK